MFEVHSPVDLVVGLDDGADEDFHVAGKHPENGQIVNDIDGATYTGPDAEPEVITVPFLGGPRVDRLLLTPSGVGGPFRLVVSVRRPDGAVLASAEERGEVLAGETAFYRLDLSPERVSIQKETGEIGGEFIRGDCSGDGEVAGSVTDGIALLSYLFLGGAEPPCLAACDANGDGVVQGQVTDAIHLFSFNFLGGPAPPAPYPDCGPETPPGDESLSCAEPPEKCR